MYVHFWTHLFCTFPQSSDTTCVDHHESMVALSKWRYFHLREKNVYVGLYFQYYFHAYTSPTFLDSMIKCNVVLLKHRMNSESCDIMMC